MKRFILHSLLFSLILSLLLCITDIRFSPLLFPDSVWYKIYHNKIDYEIAFFGSSRCQEYFDCSIIEQSIGHTCYNFGMPNAKIDISCLCLDYLLQHNQRPKYATLEVGYITLFNNSTLDHHYHIYPLMYLHPSVYNYVKKYQGFDSKQIWIPLYRYSGYIGSIIKETISKDNTIKGFVPVHKYWKYNVLGAHFNKSVPIDSSRIKFLDRFVDLCVKNNIKLNFVYVPEHTNYKDFYNNKQEIVEYFQEYAKNKGIPFKDFSADSIFNSDTSYFYNIEHVNKYGAAKFTRDYFVPYFKQLYNL